jgi:hypothetical protein
MYYCFEKELLNDLAENKSSILISIHPQLNPSLFLNSLGDSLRKFERINRSNMNVSLHIRFSKESASKSIININQVKEMLEQISQTEPEDYARIIVEPIQVQNDDLAEIKETLAKMQRFEEVMWHIKLGRGVNRK